MTQFLYTCRTYLKCASMWWLFYRFRVCLHYGSFKYRICTRCRLREMIESVVHVRLLSRERLGFLNAVYCTGSETAEKGERRLGTRRSQDKSATGFWNKGNITAPELRTCSLGCSRLPKLLIISTANVVCMYVCIVYTLRCATILLWCVCT